MSVQTFHNLLSGYIRCMSVDRDDKVLSGVPSDGARNTELPLPGYL